MNCFDRYIRFCFTVCAWILVCFAAPVFSEPGPPQATVSFDTATRLIHTGRFLEAIEMYQSIQTTASHDTTKARALFFCGSTYDHYLDQPEKALACYSELFQRYPDSPSAPDALFNSGRTLYKMDRFDDAHAAFQQYISTYPDGIRFQSALAWAKKARENRSLARPSEPTETRTRPTLSGTIRVLLATTEPRIVFNAPEPITVSDTSSGKPFFTGSGPVILSKGTGTIRINTINTPFHGVTLTSQSPLSVGGIPYHGRFVVYSEPTGLTVVNHVNVESYLYGVVPKEMSWLWSDAALMAQAIASRTYALYIRDKQPRSARYDLEATTASQVYGGIPSEKQETSRAVNVTRGKVLTFEGRLIIAYFHADSGGHTESASRVWGTDLPYLQATKDSFSTLRPDTDWECFFSYKTLNTLLKPSIPNLGIITGVSPQPKTESGRTPSLRFDSDSGNALISSNAFRIIAGPTVVKSTLFDLVSTRSGVTFKGTGYGHGVGMSQWGAHRMAQAGYTYQAILKHYYPGTSIDRIIYR